jgi:hypothetical protein
MAVQIVRWVQQRLRKRFTPFFSRPGERPECLSPLLPMTDILPPLQFPCLRPQTRDREGVCVGFHCSAYALTASAQIAISFRWLPCGLPSPLGPFTLAGRGSPSCVRPLRVCVCVRGCAVSLPASCTQGNLVTSPVNVVSWFILAPFEPVAATYIAKKTASRRAANYINKGSLLSRMRLKPIGRPRLLSSA